MDFAERSRIFVRVV